VIVLGLEEGNVERLRKGQPIHIHADELGFAGEIVIVLGENTDALLEQFSEWIGPDTKINDYRRRKKQ
jgi:hypothetical protein